MKNLRRFIPYRLRWHISVRACRLLDQHVCGYPPACTYETKAQRESMARMIAHMRGKGKL